MFNRGRFNFDLIQEERKRLIKERELSLLEEAGESWLPEIPAGAKWFLNGSLVLENGTRVDYGPTGSGGGGGRGGGSNGNWLVDGGDYPKGTQWYPDGTVLYPDGNLRGLGCDQPEWVCAPPDGARWYNNGTLVYPDGTTKQLGAPDAGGQQAWLAKKYPKGTVWYPNGSVVFPNGTAAEIDKETIGQWQEARVRMADERAAKARADAEAATAAAIAAAAAAAGGGQSMAFLPSQLETGDKVTNRKYVLKELRD